MDVKMGKRTFMESEGTVLLVSTTEKLVLWNMLGRRMQGLAEATVILCEWILKR